MSRQNIWEENYYCYSIAFSDKAHLEYGDKIILPPSALESLSQIEIQYPMQFQLSKDTKYTHCGVSEFTAEEGTMYIPFWMMQNLLIEEGSLIMIKNVSLSKAKYIKLRAQSVDFLDIQNPKIVLEYTLKKFSCATVGDIIKFSHEGKEYYLEFTEVQPNNAVSIIETDCEVDFDEPLGFKGSKYDYSACKNIGTTSLTRTSVGELQKAKQEDTNKSCNGVFKPFGGISHRTDGKSLHAAASSPISCESVSIEHFQSKIGDKFSKKKVAVSVFTGPSHKLNG